MVWWTTAICRIEVVYRRAKNATSNGVIARVSARRELGVGDDASVGRDEGRDELVPVDRAPRADRRQLAAGGHGGGRGLESHWWWVLGCLGTCCSGPGRFLTSATLPAMCIPPLPSNRGCQLIDRRRYSREIGHVECHAALPPRCQGRAGGAGRGDRSPSDPLCSALPRFRPLD